MTTRTKLARLAVAGGVAIGIAAAPANADPKGETFPLVCNNGETYDVTTNGNGNFTPAHNADGTNVFIPLAFGEFKGTVTDAQGNVVDSFSEPGIEKGKGNAGKNATATISCTFSFSGTEDGLTFNASGSVLGYVTPRGK